MQEQAGACQAIGASRGAAGWWRALSFPTGMGSGCKTGWERGKPGLFAFALQWERHRPCPLATGAGSGGSGSFQLVTVQIYGPGRKLDGFLLGGWEVPGRMAAAAGAEGALMTFPGGPQGAQPPPTEQVWWPGSRLWKEDTEWGCGGAGACNRPPVLGQSPDLVPTLNPGHMNLYFSFPLPPGVCSIHFCFKRMSPL